MTLEQNTRAIIALAWGRRLGVGDELSRQVMEDTDLEAPRIEVALDDARSAMVVSLFGQVVVRGPRWFVERSRGVDDAELINESTLIELTRDHQGRGIGQALLSYADHPRFTAVDEPLELSTDAADARRLESLCPPDDISEVNLSAMDEVLVVERDGQPIAGAGYDEWEGLLAQLGVLVAPAERRRGWATKVAAAALEEACAQGLIGQWRVSVLNPESQRVAERLGFEVAGSQTSVSLP